MTRKFECWNCQHRFEADDSQWVECPQCGSDNVEYARSHIPSIVAKCVCGVAIALALAGFGWWIVQNYNGGGHVSMPEERPQDIIIVEDDTLTHDTLINETGMKIPPKLIPGKPVFENDSYSFSARAEGVEEGTAFIWALLDLKDNKKVVSRSNDGQFREVPPSDAEGGKYRLVLLNVKGDSMLCEPVPVIGFIPQKRVSTRMSAEWLQQQIESGSEVIMGVGESDYLAPDVKISYSGLLTSDDHPSTLYGVYEKIVVGEWQAVKVTSVGYDEMNRIATVKFEIIQ
jgi:predicted  nucleic acid-binding Zn-ribbon protein